MWHAAPMLDSISVEGEAEAVELRHFIVEGFAVMEAQIDGVLALILGREERDRDAIYKEVIWRVPIDDRIALLLRLLDQDDLADFFPFLKLLPEVVVMRNVFAHMVLNVFKSTDDTLMFMGRRRGDAKNRKVDLALLRRVAHILDHGQTDLEHLTNHIEKVRGVQAPTPAPTDPPEE
jgi:hypothetical protein